MALGRSSIRINHNAYRGYEAIAHDLYRIQSSCSLIRVVVRATFNQNIAITKTGFSVIGTQRFYTFAQELRTKLAQAFASHALIVFIVDSTRCEPSTISAHLKS